MDGVPNVTNLPHLGQLNVEQRLDLAPEHDECGDGKVDEVGARVEEYTHIMNDFRIHARKLRWPEVFLHELLTNDWSRNTLEKTLFEVKMSDEQVIYLNFKQVEGRKNPVWKLADGHTQTFVPFHFKSNAKQIESIKPIPYENLPIQMLFVLSTSRFIAGEIKTEWNYTKFDGETHSYTALSEAGPGDRYMHYIQVPPVKTYNTIKNKSYLTENCICYVYNRLPTSEEWKQLCASR